MEKICLIYGLSIKIHAHFFLKGCNHLCGLIIWLNFTPKFAKIQELTRALPPGNPPGRCPGPTWALKAGPEPHAFAKKSTPSPLARIPGSAPDNYIIP